jgi:hypothetical protein
MHKQQQQEIKPVAAPLVYTKEPYKEQNLPRKM